MNWQRWLAGVVMLAVAGTAAAPQAARIPPANVAVNGNPPAWGIVPVNNDASDGMPSDGHLASRNGEPDNGFIDYALGDLFWNQGAPGSPYVRNANGNPVSHPSTDDQPAGWTRNVAGWTAPQPFWAPQFTQWPYAPGTNPQRTAAVYSILDASNGDQDKNGVIELGIDLGLLPAANGPTTIDELPCPPSCSDDPVATNRSSSAVAEPATLSLLGLGMLAFAGLRRRAQRARPANMQGERGSFRAAKIDRVDHES